jgi:PGF-pre-PGF domain-containing protein
VKNIGNVDLTGVSVNDTLITLTEPTGDNIEPGVLNPGETWKYKGNYTVTQNDINSNGGGDGDIDNKATVSSNELPDENSSKEQLILLASTSTNNADITPTPTDDVDQNGDDDSGNGGSSGGGGGGGGSPEPAGNIKVKELAQAFVTNGKEARFNFTKNATCVVYVSFDAKKTMGKITTTVEMLKGKSTLTRDAPEGEVYDYLNIWVGSGGYATEKNIENAVVCFKVEKARMEEKGINESSITLNRYNDGKWSKLPVSLLKEDNKYLYFTAKTPGFSPFAITGQTNGLDADIRGTESESEINASEGYTEYTESETEQKDGKSTPGFELVYGIVSLLAIFLYRRK